VAIGGKAPAFLTSGVNGWPEDYRWPEKVSNASHIAMAGRREINGYRDYSVTK